MSALRSTVASRVGDAGLAQPRAALGLELLQHRIGRLGLESGREAQRVRARRLEGQRRGEEAERRGRAGGRRHDHVGDAQQAGHVGGVRGAGAAEADHGVAARIGALLDDVDAGGGRHVLGDQAVDAPRRLDRRELELRGDARQRRLGGARVELHPAPEEEVRVVVAEREVRVGHRRLDAAAPVAGGPGIGPGRARPDLEEAHLVDGGDRSAAGADLDHVDHRRLDRQARPLAEAVDPRDLGHRPPRRRGRRGSGTPSRWCRPCRTRSRPPCRRARRRTRLRARRRPARIPGAGSGRPAPPGAR